MTTGDDALEPADAELVRLLACGMSYSEAGETVGMSKATVYRRMRDPAVREAVDRERSAVVDSAVRSLLDLADRAVGVHARVMDDETAPLGARLRAAMSVLDRTGHSRGAEITIADAREMLLTRLREAVEEQNAGPPN